MMPCARCGRGRLPLGNAVQLCNTLVSEAAFEQRGAICERDVQVTRRLIARCRLCPLVCSTCPKDV
eukprot:14532766-Alexandrium_andersonii.AAC.1